MCTLSRSHHRRIVDPSRVQLNAKNPFLLHILTIPPVDPRFHVCYHRTRQGGASMYMIIVGAGSIGTSLIDIAVCEKNNVVLIDVDVERARAISNRYDITVLSGDATSADMIREAGAERADALIVTTSDDAVNLMVVSIAASLSIPSIVSVVNETEHTDFFRKLGANVMENPEDVVAQHLYNAVKQPNVQDFALLPQGAQIFRLQITEKSPLAGRSIADSIQRGTIPESVRILAIARPEEDIQSIAMGDSILSEDDILTVFSLQRVSDDVIEKLVG
ncbi:MAG: TrkA family potassium uptake protein [Candidatus Atribacteria bacterium]|nr:MAG: TrkA family potassium uptake protein [Candidatus Atribacteria bacterium]